MLGFDTLKETYCCIITCADENEKIVQEEIICDSLIDAARCLITYKPGKKYEIRHIMIHKENLLL